MMKSRRLWITLVLLAVCVLAARAWLSRERPLTRAECAAKAQSLAIGCGAACSAKLARSSSAQPQRDYMDCNDLCSKRLVEVVKRCGR